MNLDELRSQLRHQADEIDPATPVPLPTIRRRTKTLKRRRLAGLAGGVVAVVAVAVGLLPSVVDDSAPDPAKPPPDYTRYGVTVPGHVDADLLQRGWVGKPGEVPLEFAWTVRSTSLTLRPYCRTSAKHQLVQVTINGHLMLEKSCDDVGRSPSKAESISPTSLLWADTQRGDDAKVRVVVVDEQSKLADDRTAQVALGIYSSPPPATGSNGAPLRVPSPQPGDYVKDLIRYRARTGADTLAAATVGDPGQSKVSLRFTATGAPMALRLFCTANKGTFSLVEYRLAVEVNGGPARKEPCYNVSSDPSIEGNMPLTGHFPAGQPMEVTVGLVDMDGVPVSSPDVRLGVGAYFQQPLRIITDRQGGTKSLEQTIESDGYNYKLAKVQIVDATKARTVTLETPANRPYLLVTGSTPLGAQKVSGSLTGVVGEVRLNQSVPLDESLPLVVTPQPAAATAGSATTRLTTGKPTRGVLILAIYLPE